ncbi:MAG: LytR C-terminal domain-containing protein, partial [bacterium]|nr:LytR C-terminal domain-containing protein [bacterium]
FMQGIKTEENVAQEMHPIEGKNIDQVPNVTTGTSHESLWGAVLFAGMLLFVVASIGGVGWVAYTKWQSERVAKNQPSITVLSEQSGGNKNVASAEPAKTLESEPAQEPSVSDSTSAAKKLGISVLNGGAAKGSAGVLANFLKQEGYSKTDLGNTLKDYAGVGVYYASGLEKEAEVIKESVVKKYPQVKILPADPQNKETSVSQITIILGK